MGKQELLITLGMQDATFQQKIKAVNRQLKLTDANFEKLKAQTKNFGKSQKDLANEMQYLQKKIKETSTNLGTYEKRIEEVNKAISDSEKKHDTLTKQIEDEKKKLKTLGVEQGKSSEEYKKQKEKVQNLVTELDRCDRSLITHRAALQNARLGYVQTETSIAQLEQRLGKVKAKFDSFKLDKLAAQFDKISKSMTTMGKQMMSTGSTLTASVTTPIVGFGTIATKTFVDFEEQVRKTNAIIDKGKMTNEESYDAIMSKSRELGRTTIFTAQQVAEGMSFMALAGWSTEESLSAVKSILDLSAISMTDLSTASDIVTDAMTPMGMAAKDASKFVDVMAATITRSNTDVIKLGESFKYATPVAGNLGISIEDLSIALGLMANSGVKASSAGTSFATGMARLVSPTDKAAAAMKKYGVAVQYDAKTGSVDLMKTMENLRDTLGKLNKKTKQQAIDTIFGKTAMKGWSAIISATTEDFNSLTNAVNNSDGATQKMLDEIEQGGAFSFKLLTSAINDMLITLGDFLAPAMTEIANIITDLTVKFSNWLEYMKENEKGTLKFISVVVLLTAALGPLLMLLGGLTLAFSAPFKVASKFLKLFTPNKDGDPSKLFETIKKGLDKTKTGGKSAFDTLKKGITGTKGVLTKFMNVGKQGLTLMKNILLGNVLSWKELGKAIKPIFTSMLNGVKGFVGAFLNFDQTVMKIGSSIKGLALKVVNSFGDGLINGFKKLTGTTLFKVIMEPFDAIATGMVGIFKGVWNAMKDPIGMVSKLFSNLNNTVMKYCVAIATSPKTAFSMLLKDIGKMFNNFKGTIAKLFPTLSGILSKNFGGIITKIGGFASSALKIVLSVVKNPFGAIKTVITTVAPMITGAFSTVVGSLTGGLATIGGTLLRLFNPVTLVIGLVVGLIATFVKLYKTSDEFRTKITSAFEQVKGAFVRVKESLSQIGGQLVLAFNKIKDAAMPTLIMLGEKTKEVFEKIKNKVTEVATKFKDGFDSIVSGITWFGNLLKENFANIGQNIMTIFGGMWSAILDGLTGFIDFVATILVGAFDVISALINGFVTGDFSQFGQALITALQNILVSMMGFILNGIKNLGTILSGIGPILSGIFTTCIDLLKQWISDFIQKVKDFGSNVVKNLKDGLSNVKDTITKPFKDAYNSVSEWWGKIKDIVKHPIKAVVELVKPDKQSNKKPNKKKKSLVDDPGVDKASLLGYTPQVANVASIANVASFKEVEQNFKARTPNLGDFKTKGGFYSPVSIKIKDKIKDDNSSNSDTNKLIMALQKQNELLMQLLVNTSNQTVNVGLQIDGRQVAKASAKYMNEEITKIDNRKNRLGGKLSYGL